MIVNNLNSSNREDHSLVNTLIGPRSMETLARSLDALEFLVKTPSVELPSGPLQEWVEEVRGRHKIEQVDIIFSARHFPERITPHMNISKSSLIIQDPQGSNKMWYEQTPPHLIVHEESELRRTVTDLNSKFLVLDQELESLVNKPAENIAGNKIDWLKSRLTRTDERIFIVVQGPLDSEMEEVCTLIAKRGRAIQVHLIALFQSGLQIPLAIAANTQIL